MFWLGLGQWTDSKGARAGNLTLSRKPALFTKLFFDAHYGRGHILLHRVAGSTSKMSFLRVGGYRPLTMTAAVMLVPLLFEGWPRQADMSSWDPSLTAIELCVAWSPVHELASLGVLCYTDPYVIPISNIPNIPNS